MPFSLWCSPQSSSFSSSAPVFVLSLDFLFPQILSSRVMRDIRGFFLAVFLLLLSIVCSSLPPFLLATNVGPLCPVLSLFLTLRTASRHLRPPCRRICLHGASFLSEAKRSDSSRGGRRRTRRSFSTSRSAIVLENSALPSCGWIYMSVSMKLSISLRLYISAEREARRRRCLYTAGPAVSAVGCSQ